MFDFFKKPKAVTFGNLLKRFARRQEKGFGLQK